MAQPVTGGCLCGAVRFQFPAAPIAARACWCRVCQYLAAGNASVNAMFRTEGLTVTGELGDYVCQADSGNTMRRRFCRACGTQIFSESVARPDIVVVRVGTLDDREAMRPSSYIWTASAPSWAVIDASLPSCEGQPGPVAAPPS